ncbi:flagellar hook-associated protein 2 [Salisediminibacterium selenitireducens]|uniref:Flagellar hook-associated protein 2 n=1 Tax=Bacillus selenitireducens (strain ATCC 700615 / DSM 15326 / MLS10) TaxID=439292 RepID=D6Y0X6_BACIE|nr:flagellar hook-associated protein 2 [Salisediminibacterium selenitireducens]ADH98580.1 flagellar hook-associated 2 domain protein [[Bacillus] selenitireducens MLS10]
MRISGFATGMDINQMVTDLMRAERMPVDRMQQNKQLLEWRMEEFRTINRKLETFRTNIFDGVFRSANMLAKTGTSSDESRVSVTAASNAQPGTMRINSVSSLAESEALVSEALTVSGETATRQTTLADLTGSSDPEFTLEVTTRTSSGEKNETFTFASTDKVDDVLKKINSSDLGLNAFFDTQTGQISFSREETGLYDENGSLAMGGSADAQIAFADSTLASAFGVQEGQGTRVAGSNAVVNINGIDTERGTNTFTENGLTITLRDTFSSDPVTIGSATDTDKIFDTIMDFVNEYNELVEHVNEKLREDRNRDFRPLTDDQREALSEREIERWEEQAMSGMLRNDRILRGGFDQFRSAMYTPVSLGEGSSFNQLAQIGITTTNNFRDGGKLEVNEDRLRAKINEDPDAVFRLFTADGSSQSEKGLARRIRESANSLIDSIAREAGGSRGRNLNHQFTLGRGMDQIDDRITNFERRLEQVEQRYWSQFTAMEKAVAQSNSQAESLFAQMYGGMM